MLHLVGGYIHLPGQALTEVIWLKLHEQIERTEHVIQLLPSDSIGWDPRLPQGSTDLGHLLGHLLDCLAGFCAVFHAAFPRQLAHLGKLRSQPVNHFCRPDDAVKRVQIYMTEIERAF